MGTWTAALWAVGVGWVWLQPETHAALAERVRAAVGSDVRMFALIDPTAIAYRGAVSGNRRVPDRRGDARRGGAPFQRAARQSRRD